jgi:hypothetical protein
MEAVSALMPAALAAWRAVGVNAHGSRSWCSSPIQKRRRRLFDLTLSRKAAPCSMHRSAARIRLTDHRVRGRATAALRRSELTWCPRPPPKNSLPRRLKSLALTVVLVYLTRAPGAGSCHVDVGLTAEPQGVVVFRPPRKGWIGSFCVVRMQNE